MILGSGLRYKPFESENNWHCNCLMDDIDYDEATPIIMVSYSRPLSTTPDV